MDIKELKANHPELVQAIENETLQTVESEVNSLKVKVEDLEKEKGALASTVVAKETELSNKKAAEIFSSAFSASSIPSKFSAKVEKDTELSSFIGADGKLDEAGYTGSVSAAISSWEKDFEGLVPENKEENKEEENKEEEKKVLGMGIKEEDNQSTDDDFVNYMVNLATK